MAQYGRLNIQRLSLSLPLSLSNYSRLLLDIGKAKLYGKAAQFKLSWDGFTMMALGRGPPP
jgi:hypothetical protein